jgi:hypothetical protein
MKIIVKLALASAVVLGVALSFIHPAGRVKGQASTEPLLAGAEADGRIMKILERSCQNCHSERTEWPWYSYVAPLSWLVEADVHNGRSHMNLSRWRDYSPDRQRDILTRLGVEVRTRQMPLSRYLRIHQDAALSDEEIKQLYVWAHRERSRLAAPIDANSRALTP